MRKKRGLSLLLTATMVTSLISSFPSANIIYADDLQTDTELIMDTDLPINEVESEEKQDNESIGVPIESIPLVTETTEHETVTESVYEPSIVVYNDRVYNIATGEGIEGVEIVLISEETSEEYSTTTDVEGNFFIEVYPGEYSLILNREGFKLLTIHISIEDERRIADEI